MHRLTTLLRKLRKLTGRTSRGSNHQRGISIITLAVAAMVGGTIMAVPMLNRAAGALRNFEVSAVGQQSARAAAEHALWRLQYDPTVHDEMDGSPPTTVYTLAFPDGTATVTIVGTEPPFDFGLAASLGVTPNVVLPDTPTEVTYTMEITNDDVIAHDLVRLEADPRSFSPDYITGSTTGLTTIDPIYQAGEWRWVLPTPVSVAPFGGAVSMSWRMTVDEDEGNYWTSGSVRFDGIGSIDAPMTANIRVVAPSEVIVSTVVTPDQVEAGELSSFTYTMTIENVSGDDYTLETIKHFTSRDFNFVPGSSQGPTNSDPSRNHDVINDRWEWTWDVPGTPLPSGGQVVLSFQMNATLLPGTQFAVSAVITEEDSPGGQLVTAGTGNTAPIVAVRIYDVNVEFNGTQIDIEALLTADGLDTLSWIES